MRDTMTGRLRAVLALADAAVAVTAIGGGFALVAGLEASRFPAAWLEGTPFDSYVVPGLLLTVVVGGSAAVGAVLALVGSRYAGSASLIAGLILVSWIVGEIVFLTGDGELVSVTELLYLGLGLLLVALGTATIRRRRPLPADP